MSASADSHSPTDSPLSPEERAALIKQTAADMGFALCGIAPAVTPLTWPQFSDWLDAGHHGEMHYMERRRDAYQHPRHVLESVRSVIMLAVTYDPDRPASSNQKSTPVESTPVENLPAEADSLTPVGRIARYARSQVDYHTTVKQMLRELADQLHQIMPGCHTRAVVDTAPLLERDFARQAGLGWFGKNTLLINKSRGSFFFLGAILTDLDLPADAPHTASHCGTCTRCLDVCPTDALREPHVLDARRCLAYLTIELRDQPIPTDLRHGLQDWMFGCDLCQEVCPWNRHAPAANRPEFLPAISTQQSAVEFLQLTTEQFRQKYKHTPLSRPGRPGMARNAAIVLGNTHNPDYLPILLHALHDESPLVRGAAIWAIRQITPTQAPHLLHNIATHETNPTVLTELQGIAL